jgi:DNA-binding transcriptional MerR regulator
MEQTTAIDPNQDSGKPAKSAAAFRTISEVSGELDVPQHVLRFWETKFSQIKPLKRGGGRRYYRPEDLALLQRIRDLLYTEGYTIRGVQRLLRQYGVRAVVAGAVEDAGAIPAASGLRKAASGAAGSKPGLDPKVRKELQSVLSELIKLRGILDEGGRE